MPFDFNMDSISPVESGGGSANITSLNVTPTTSAQTITASGGVDGYSPVNVSAVTSSIDANIVAGNIKKDVQILGVTGTYEGGSSGEKYGANGNTFLGDVDANGVLQLPTEQSDLVFTGVKDVADYGLRWKFAYSKIKSVSFPNLITISGSNGCNNMFYGCTALTDVLLSNLTTISSERGCNNMFYNCTALISVSLPSLTTISGDYGCANMFYGCTALTDVYFPALTTTSFGSVTNQFGGMMGGTGTGVTHTLHFPSNLESKIQSLSGYPLFGGTSGYVVLAFDLPATS